MAQDDKITLGFKRIVQKYKARTGNLANLLTANKTNLVAAINELVAAMGGGTSAMPVLSDSSGFAAATANLVMYQGHIWRRLAGTVTPNGGTIINGTSGYYYERQFTGPVRAEWFGAAGNGTTDCLSAFNSGQADAINRGIPLAFGSGTFLFSGTPYFTSGLTLEGAGKEKTFFTFNSSFSGTQLLSGNGCSNLILRDFSVTGTAKELDSAIRLNSYPNQARNIYITRVGVKNFWGHGIQLGGAGGSDPLHFNADIWITGCTFKSIGNPANLNVTNDTDLRYNGIHLNQTTKRCFIEENTFDTISGDGVFGWDYMFKSSDVETVSVQIKDNYFTRCWMFVEFPSEGAAHKSQISGNIMLYPNRHWGFAISLSGDQVLIQNNTIHCVERHAIEAACTSSRIEGNTIKISVAKDMLAGQAVAGSNTNGAQVNAIDLYNSANVVFGNTIRFDPVYANGSVTALRLRAIQMVNKHSDIPAYMGYTDLGVGNEIEDNTVYGATGALVAASNSAFRKTIIRDNRYVSAYSYEGLIIIQGYNWLIEKNTFDMTGNASTGNVVEYSGLQSGNSGTFIDDNTIVATTWTIPATSTHHTAKLIKYLNPSTGALTVTNPTY